MEAFFKTILALHIAGGTAGLVFSILAMAVAKGGRAHRLLGLAFFWGMVGAGASSIALAVMHPNPFLGAIGIFSLYLSLSGRRALAWRRLDKGLSTEPDAAIQMAMGLCALAMWGYAALLFTSPGSVGTGVVLAVFGSIGMVLVAGDYSTVFRGRRVDTFWLKAHITKMLAATISAYTAFGVVNMERLAPLPPLAIWLLPTLVGSLVITYWQVRVAKGKARLAVSERIRGQRV